MANLLKTLIITNGDATLPHFKSLYPSVHAIAFSEAMCYGNSGYKIFSEAFCRKRAKVHEVKYKEYVDKTAKNFNAIITENYDNFILFFDTDMFCAINLITLLAFFDANQIRGKIELNYIDYDNNIIESIDVKCDGYKKLYNKVVVNKTFMKANISHVQSGINMYLELGQDDNPLTRFIEAQPELSSYKLCVKILQSDELPKYGLGDTQLLNAIEKVRNRDDKK